MHGLRDVVQELGFLARPRFGVEGADHQALDQAGGGGVLQREHAPHDLHAPGRRDVRDVHDKFARVDMLTIIAGVPSICRRRFVLQMTV